MKLLFETVSGKKVLKEFKNGTLAKNFIIKNKNKLSKAQILDEGFLQNVGKGAVVLSWIGAMMLGLANKPADAKGMVSPTNEIKVTTEFNNANGKGFVHQTTDKNGTTKLSKFDDENCKRLYSNSESNNNRSHFNQELYSLECQSPNGKYVMKVTISNNSSGNNGDNISDNISTNTITVSSKLGEKTINLDKSNNKKLKDIVINALQRDMQDGKIIEMNNGEKVSAVDMVKGNILGNTSIANNMKHNLKDKN